MTTIEQAVKSVFQPSPQQQNFFDWIADQSGSCVLEAVAGSGKTTTLIEALKLMEGFIFFGAYNKKIAEEIKQRAPAKDKLTISTMHAAGLRIWTKAAGQVKINSNKCRDIFRDACLRYPQYSAYEAPVLSLVSLAKQAAIGAITPIADYSAWLNLIDHFDVDCFGEEDMVIKLARKTLERSIEADRISVDFDDMIYAPLVHKVRAFEYDWVLIDEAQDTNASRRALALLMLKRGGRLVAVGDRHQAIYGFTGADANSLDLIAKAVDAIQMPLTVSYRCPQKVVEYAKQFVNHIQHHESAIMGEVVNSSEPLIKIANPGDAIICRFNAPLITNAYQFIAAGIPAKVEGRDIGNGMKNLARRWKVKTFEALQTKLETYLDREVAKYRAKEQESKAVSVEDRVSCLNILIERVRATDPHPKNPVEVICSEIDKIFGEDVGSEYVLFSTIHKSKGREWNNVIWLQTGPSKWARKEWELEQENNLCYVVSTRAKVKLTLVQISK